MTVRRVYAAHGVHDRRSLLRRLGLTPPVTPYELQREEDRRRRAAGQKWKRIAAEMGLPFHVVVRHGKGIAKEAGREHSRPSSKAHACDA